MKKLYTNFKKSDTIYDRDLSYKVKGYLKGDMLMTEQQIRSLMEHHRERGEEALFETYYRYVYAIAFRIIHSLGTCEDVEECVIDVFVDFNSLMSN